MLVGALIALAGLSVHLLRQQSQMELRTRQAEHESQFASSFADRMVAEVAAARGVIDVMGEQRRDLLNALQKSETMTAALGRLLGDWQRAHRDLKNETDQTQQQWSEYARSLEQNLGGAKLELAAASDTLRQEQDKARQQIADLNESKTGMEQRALSLEGEANALAAKARSLDGENSQLSNDLARKDGEISRLRQSLATLESDRAALSSRNSCLESENSHLRQELSCLQGRISSLERAASRSSDAGDHPGGDGPRRR